VLLHFGAEELEIDVEDDGTGPAGSGGGVGLVGLAERAAAVGGALQAGAGAEGGFRLHARLPLDRPS
jgi:signal transduction histidine kinase